MQLVRIPLLTKFYIDSYRLNYSLDCIREGYEGEASKYLFCVVGPLAMELAAENRINWWKSQGDMLSAYTSAVIYWGRTWNTGRMACEQMV